MRATVALNGLRSARNQIECAFDLRKARCAILTRKVDLKLENLPNLMCVCFVLHKKKKKEKKSYIDEELIKAQSKFDKQNERNHVNVLDQIYSSNGSEGFVVRRLLTELT